VSRRFDAHYSSLKILTGITETINLNTNLEKRRIDVRCLVSEFWGGNEILLGASRTESFLLLQFNFLHIYSNFVFIRDPWQVEGKSVTSVWCVNGL